MHNKIYTNFSENATKSFLQLDIKLCKFKHCFCNKNNFSLIMWNLTLENFANVGKPLCDSVLDTKGHGLLDSGEVCKHCFAERFILRVHRAEVF